MRPSVVLPIAALLTGLVGGLCPTARADDPGPLYQLVDTAAARLQTADPVAAVKWLRGGSIEDPPRVAQVLDAVQAAAREHGVDPGVVRTVFTDQVRATQGVEYVRFSQWKFDPDTAPTTAPDLSASRAEIDGFNRAMVDQIALQWDSLHGPACAQDLAEAKGAVAADRRLDPLYTQALDVATASYCG